MTIRLLALDLDGTLLDPYGQLTDRNLQALASARELGVQVALVTGRRFRDARPVALQLDLDAPIIAHNGALTKHALTLETVAVQPLPLAAAKDVLRVGRETGFGPMVSDDHSGLGVLVYDPGSNNNESLRRYIAWTLKVHGDDGRNAVIKVESLEEYLDHEPIHIAFSGACAEMRQLKVRLQTAIGEQVKIFSTEYPAQNFTLLDIVHPAVSKGAGVAAAAAELGLEREEVLAMGDNFNDLEMLHYAGIGVVMGNADPALKQLEGLHVTESNSRDGVAVAIEKFILEADQAGENDPVPSPFSLT